MNKDKQIEEMAKTMCFQRESCAVTSCTEVNCETTWLAENLYNAGYRKASEIFEEIEKIIDKHYNKHIFGSNDLEDEEIEAVINFSDDVTYDIDKLKKKYESEGERE